MSKIVLVANRVENLQVEKNCAYMGIDGGSLYCLNHKVPMVCAVGDFDSITQSELTQLEENTKVIKLPAEKDVADTEYALSYANKLGYSEIEIVGVMGGRQDHFLAVYQLLKSGDIPFIMTDMNNIISRYEAGEYVVDKKMRYLSFFACEPLVITVHGVKYPLNQKEIDEKDVYLVSNEIIESKARLKISGRIIVIQSNSLE